MADAQMPRPHYLSIPSCDVPQSSSPASVESPQHSSIYMHLPLQLHYYPEPPQASPFSYGQHASHPQHCLDSQPNMMSHGAPQGHMLHAQRGTTGSPWPKTEPQVAPQLQRPQGSPVPQVRHAQKGAYIHSPAGVEPNVTPGPIPATTPLVVRDDGNGVQWIAFEYSLDRVRMEYTIRCDVESVSVDALSPEFKQENCIYPRACCPNQYRGNRLRYETDCNRMGWALAQLNAPLRGKRGLIQRAVDSWRNSNQDLGFYSRRVRRMAKMNKSESSQPSHAISTQGLGKPACVGQPIQHDVKSTSSAPKYSFPVTASPHRLESIPLTLPTVQPTASAPQPQPMYKGNPTPRPPDTPSTPTYTHEEPTYEQTSLPSSCPGIYAAAQNPYPPQHSYETAAPMTPQLATSAFYPRSIAPATVGNGGLPVLRPMPPGGIMPYQSHRTNVSSPYGAPPALGSIMQGNSMMSEEQPTRVVGSQGRRGILSSAPGRPAAVPAGSDAKSTVVPMKDADGKFPCPYCTKTYLHAKHLKRHILRHTGDRPYMCGLCQDTFSRNDVLKRHFQKCSIRRENPTGASPFSHPQRQDMMNAAQPGNTGDFNSHSNANNMGSIKDHQMNGFMAQQAGQIVVSANSGSARNATSSLRSRISSYLQDRVGQSQSGRSLELWWSV